MNRKGTAISTNFPNVPRISEAYAVNIPSRTVSGKKISEVRQLISLLLIGRSFLGTYTTPVQESSSLTKAKS